MKLLPNFIAKRPSVPECDFSGVIVDGNGSAFSVGEKVFGSVRPGTCIPACPLNVKCLRPHRGRDQVQTRLSRGVRIPPRINCMQAARERHRYRSRWPLLCRTYRLGIDRDCEFEAGRDGVYQWGLVFCGRGGDPDCEGEGVEGGGYGFGEK